MRILPLAAVLVLAAKFAFAAEPDWMTNYDQALKASKESGKPVFVDFTGSDWCGWCIKLAGDTFSKPAFADYAKDNLVLLEVDKPMQKKLPADVEKQNAMLMEKFGIEGFPTLVLLDSTGKEIARHVGYMEGGPDAMIAWIKESTAKKK
jgi:thioredoxin-related protein